MGCGQLKWKVISRGKPINYPRPLRSRFIRLFRPGRVLSTTPNQITQLIPHLDEYPNRLLCQQDFTHC
ncbi:hypothetical protein GB937_010706 [Aspergillus fischeri]|nr:hypothetical protein GB937_010706 [Aspergillus fischeri]